MLYEVITVLSDTLYQTDNVKYIPLNNCAINTYGITTFRITSYNVCYTKLLRDVLTKTNTTAFTPDADYEPATKKYVDDAAGGTYAVGDTVLGGIVFWVDESEEHGLVCAKEDQSTAVRWYGGTTGNIV